jgi:hypothetical protein
MRRFLLLLATGGILIWGMAACRGLSLSGELTPVTQPTQAPASISTRAVETPLAGSQPLAPTSENTAELENIPVPMMGAEIKRLGSEKNVKLMRDTGARLVRHNSLAWSDVEPVEGERQWEAVAKLEKGIILAVEQGLEIILVVRSTPPWAQLYEGSYCGPIKPEKLSAFAAFLSDLVVRYGSPPFNVKYWELGNEPDVDHSVLPGDSVFGCWGDENDEYYGGGYYSEMLKAAYPAIKAADPSAQVLTGGLLLDCDPAHPPEGKDCKPAKFLEGILLNGGGNYFDFVSFHGYPFYSSESPEGELYYDEHFPSWEARGGVVLGKADYLRELMTQYGVDKPLIHTEGALICPDWNTTDCKPPAEAFYQAQADYVVWLYVRNWADGVKGTIWYQFDGPGWRHSGMLTKDQEPKPAYLAFQFLLDELGEASYTGKVLEYPNLIGHEFISGTKKIWVLWSPDGQAHQAILPSNTTAVFDKFGEPISFEAGEISVQTPIYVEFSP